MASEPVKIAIVVQGGAVTAVYSAGVPVLFAVVDYDADGADADSLVEVDTAERNGLAYVSSDYAQLRGALVVDVLAMAEGN